MDTSRIVIIDDSKVSAINVENALKPFFANISVFENPYEALKEIPTLNPQCIITDYEMPKMKGTQLVGMLKGNPKTRDIPVLILSAHDQDQVILEAIKAGADDYMSKKISPEIMVAKIKLCLEVKKYRASSLSEERAKAYNATVVSLNHELNNAGGVLLLTIQQFEKRHLETASKEEVLQIDKLKNSMRKMLNAIREFTRRDTVEYEEYAGNADTLMISPIKKVG